MYLFVYKNKMFLKNWNVGGGGIIMIQSIYEKRIYM